MNKLHFLNNKRLCIRAVLYTLFVMLFFAISPQTAFAQYPIKINVQVRQPVSPYLPQLLGELQQRKGGAMTRDITDRLNITIHNTDNAHKNIKLSGKIERLSPSPMNIAVRPGFQPPTPIVMAPSQMMQANQNILNQAFGGFNQRDLIFNNTSLSELNQNSGNYKLPEGTYRICISAYDYNQLGLVAPLSAPGTGCATFIICYSASAPQFVMPVSTIGFTANNFELYTASSSQVQFSWIPPSSTCGYPFGTLSYNLNIWEVFPGQAINDALYNPPIFQKENIHNTTFLLDTIRYPHVLKNNKKYVFRVKANMNLPPNSPLEIDNDGFSQLGTFTYQTDSSISTVTRGEPTKNKNALPKTETLIKGKLSYRFDDDGIDVYPLAQQDIYIKRVYAKTAKDDNGVIQFLPLTVAEQSSIPSYPEILDSKLAKTDDDGRFELTVGMTEMDRAGLLTGNDWENLFKIQYDGNDQILPKDAEASIPDAMKDMEGQIVRLYKVELVNPFFKPSEEYIQISPGGERNLNTVVVEANSYTLKVNVREVIEQQASSSDGKLMKGDFAEGATVKLYRLTHHKENQNLSIPYYEGDLLSESDWEEVEDKVLIASRTTPILSSKSDNPEDYTVDFNRLFRNPEGDLYDYIVCLEDGNGSYRLPINSKKTFPPAIPYSSGVWNLNSNAQGMELVNNSPVIIGNKIPNIDFSQFSKLKDKWSKWSYNENPDVAYLTLEKELAKPPHSVVSGKLQYKFKGDPSIPAQPYANMPVKLMVFYMMKDGEDYVAMNNDYYSNVIESYANQDLPEGYQKGLPDDWNTRTGGGSFTMEDNGKILQTTYTDAQGNFVFDFENIDSTMQEKFGLLTRTKDVNPNSQIWKTDSLVSISGDFMRVYRVVPAVNQYTAPDEDIPVQPWNDYDCGTLTSYVRTFNLEVAVKAEEPILEQNDIPVQVYYNPAAIPAYKIPNKPDVDKNKPMTVNGKSYILLREGMASKKEEETISYNLDYSDFINHGGQTKTKSESYQLKTTVFKDLVISQSSANYGDFYYIEAGGFTTERKGNITLVSDYLNYPERTMSYNWDPEYREEGQYGWVNAESTQQNELEGQILFNKDFDPDRKVRIYLAPELDGARIAGRLIDSFTTLGVHGNHGSLKLKVATSKFENGNESVDTVVYKIASNEYGYFDFIEFTEDYNNKRTSTLSPIELVINVPGYNDTIIQMAQTIQPGEQRYYDPIVLRPKCAGCFGLVADEENPSQGVAARVKVLKNGRWVDTYAYSGAPIINNRGMGNIGQGILNKGIMQAGVNASIGNPGFIDDGFRPTGMGSFSNLGGNTRANNPLGGGFNNGPNAPLFGDFAPKEDGEWRTFGGLKVWINDKGEIKKAEIVGDAKNAGMWAQYVDAINGQTQQRGIDSLVSFNMEDSLFKRDYQQRFDLPMPSNQRVEIVILPYDRSYIPDTVTVNPTLGTNLGTFLMKRRKHKIKVSLSMKTKSGGYEIPIGAIVSIDGVEEDKVVDSQGNVYFEFVNNSTSNFTLRIRPQKQKTLLETLQRQLNRMDVASLASVEEESSSEVEYSVFVPKTVNFPNEDDNVEHLISVEVKEGELIAGRVTFKKDSTAVENAIVYMDQGYGIQTDIITITDENGNYTLVGVPSAEEDGSLSEVKIGASYASKEKSYIGEVKEINLLTDNIKEVNFQIGMIDDLDLTHLLGLPIRLTKAEENSKGGYKISGEFFDLPSNPNFSVRENASGNILSFHEVAVVGSEITNESGIPLAVPLDKSVLTDNKVFPVKVYEVFNGEVRAQRGNERLRINKHHVDTIGSLQGAVRIVDNSFNFPSSYMTISNTDFYLGNFKDNTATMQTSSSLSKKKMQSSIDQKQAKKPIDTSPVPSALSDLNRVINKDLIIPIFSSEDYPLTKFSLTDIKGNGIHLNYLGFNGLTGSSAERRSYIHGDSVNLFLDLTAKIQGGIELNFNAGKAVLTHNEMKSIVNDDSIFIQLEDWDVMSTSWELTPTSGGIVLADGILNTGIVGLPFNNMAIIPGEPEGELICNSLDPATLKQAAEEGKLVLGGGAAEWRLYDDVDITFIYDPDVGTTPGEGHYKFSLQSSLGKVAYFGGLDGMTDASQVYDIHFVSSLSNGEQLFAFDGDMKPIELYNQMLFTPQRLFNYKDNFSIGGLMQMNVPDMPKNIALNLRYDYTGKELIKNELSLSLIDFYFTGNGGSEFKVDLEYEELQRVDEKVIALPGIVTLPNTTKTFNANFISIVYEGAKNLIPATGKVDLAYLDGTPSNSVFSKDNNLAYNNHGPNPRLTYGVSLADATAEKELKVQTEIFVGTADQLFGDAAKALSGSLSSMNSYGAGTGGTLSDFSNEIYNDASDLVNDLNRKGRQSYNNLLRQVNSLHLETINAYESLKEKMDVLRATGEEEFEEIYSEILEELDDLKSYSNDLYNEISAKENEFISYGDKIYNDIYGDISEEIENAQGKADEMYAELTKGITDKIDEFQTHADGVYSSIANKASGLQGMGDQLYDDLFYELSTTMDDLKDKGRGISRDVSRIVNDYQNYATQLAAGATESVEDIIQSGEEMLDKMLSEADELRQEATEAYNKVNAQVERLIAEGKDAYAAKQEEMLAHLDELREEGDALYNELLAKKQAWIEDGEAILNNVNNEIADIEAYGREKFDELSNEVFNKADELQEFAEGLYGGVEDQIGELINMGQEAYDKLYDGVGETVDKVKEIGEEALGEVDEIINEYREYGETLYNNMYETVADKVDAVKAYVESIAGDFIEYGEDMLNEVLDGPLGEVINGMNEVRNTAEQYIEMGEQKVDSIMARWPIAGEAIEAFKDFDGNDIEGSLLRIAGNMENFEGIKNDVEDKLILIANETLDGIKETLPLENISESVSDATSSDVFKGMNIDFDINTGRMTGSMYSDYLSFGAVDIFELGIEVLIDRDGWYLYSGAGVDMPAATPLNPLIFPIGIGFLAGSYSTISPSLESRVTQHSYVNQLPKVIRVEGISGLFVTGKKDILKPTSLSFDFFVADFEIGASAGLDARLQLHFGAESTKIQLGMMAFANAYAVLNVLGTCGISGSAEANVGIIAAYENTRAGSKLDLMACASINVKGSAWCAMVSGEFEESLMAVMGLCVGSTCNKAVTFELSSGSGGCSSSGGGAFDY